MGVHGHHTSKLQQRQLSVVNVAVSGLAKQHNSRIARPAPPPRLRSRGTGPRGWVGRAIDWIEPGENPASVIYGVLAVGALLAAESGRHESYADTLGSVLIALCLYWLAHAYADVLGGRLKTHERLSAETLWRALIDEAAILAGATLPLLALALTWALGVALASGVEVALWSAVGSLIGFELLAGIRARATPSELLLDAGVGMTMGLAILALKVVLH